MPQHPTWFKSEAYATWILGFALMVPVYYLNPTVYLIDTSVMNIDVADAARSFRSARSWLPISRPAQGLSPLC
jgi:uncharacterized membrane protein